MRQPHVECLTGEPEDPRRQSEEQARDDIEDEVHRHRDEPERTPLVLGAQTVDDEPDSEHDGDHDGCAADAGESEQPGSSDESDADEVVEDTVDLSGDEAHDSSLSEAASSG